MATGYAVDERTSVNGEVARWQGAARVVLQPIAAPSILGLYAFAGATLIVAAHMAGWYGSPTSPEYLFPFAAVFGGIAQFACGMWAFRARDGLATAMHGMWGSFWMAYGILWLLDATGTITIPSGAKFTELGFWFIALAAVTWMGALASLAESLGLFAVLGTLAAGSTLAAIGMIGGHADIVKAAGWVFVFAAGFAWYTASAMMLEGTFGKVVLPLFKLRRRDANIPGRHVTEPIQWAVGEPGVKHGQ